MTNGVVVSGTTVSNVRAFGNLIGTAANGTTAIPNIGNGVVIQGGAPNVRIGAADQANWHSRQSDFGNTANGILITGVGTSNAQIYGNKIGTTLDGLSATANAGSGVRVENGATGARIGSNANGNNDVLERNIISGNLGHGVFIEGIDTTSTAINGNYIGTNVLGTAALGNGQSGVRVVYGPQTKIGGVTDAERNVISGNVGDGVLLEGVTQITLHGNYIGLNAAG